MNADTPDINDLFAAITGETKPPPATPSKKWDDTLLHPEGLVGDVAKWIADSSGMYQPKFALAAALTVCGSLLSRIVKDQDGQRTNLYTLAIGKSSAGKNDPIRAVQRLLFALNRGKLLSGEVTSDSALEILLDAFPARLMLLDEVGHYIANVKSAGPSNGHLKTVMPMLTKAWSAASGALEGKTRGRDTNGKWNPPKSIIAPCVCIYGTTVPDILFNSMGFEDFADGSVPRFISFISETRPMFQAKGEIIVPENLKRQLLDALHALGADDRLFAEIGKDEPKPTWNPPRTIERDICAESIFADFEKEKTDFLLKADAGDTPLYLYGKTVENAKRIALEIAALRDHTHPIIDEYCALYAVRLVKTTVAEMVEQVRLNVANSREERNAQKITRIIRRAGADGITQSDLTRQAQGIGKRGDRDDILLDLEEAGTIRRDEVAGKGAKTITMYYYIG